MVVDFFDVGHGNCTVITTPNDKLVMFDCGHSESRPWYPSLQYAGKDIERLAITNFDNDHLSDYVALADQCHVKKYQMNWSVTGQALRDMKEPPHAPGIAAIITKVEALEDVLLADPPPNRARPAVFFLSPTRS